VAVGGGDLDPRHHQEVEAPFADGPLGLEGALQGVVVGDGDAVEAGLEGRLQDLLDLVPPVGEGGVDVEVEAEGGRPPLPGPAPSSPIPRQLQTSLGSVISPEMAEAAAVAGEAR
jgi:hypothetical protein